METDKVVWSEGMFLSPQHFQQQERYMENFTREFVHQNSLHCYGLSQLTLDLALLKLGKVGVRKAKGIFPDGTPFSIQEGIFTDIPKNIVNKRVYLALPLVRTGTVNVGDNPRLRYSSKEHQVFDTSCENNEPIILELAELNVLIKIEGDELQDYTLLPFAQVCEHKAEGEVILNQAFVPNCLQFGVSHYLKDSVSDLLAQMQYRASTTAKRLQSVNSSKSYQTLIRDYLWLQTLGNWLPKVKHWHEDSSFLTKQLYLELVSMCGQMRGLEGKMPIEFSIWNPNDLYGIFSRVLAELMVQLREVQIDNVTTLKWDMGLFSKRRLLRTLVQDRSLYNEGRFILVVTSSIGAIRLGNEFPQATKLAGNSMIAELTRNALSGVPLRNLPFAPSELKAKHDAAYFEIDTQSELWQELIKKDEPIALHIDERIEDVYVEFHVIK
ncbi:type VI secretion system baseplate subunit TssK [Vibrio cholerae]|uniref:type VI secretion system baseplate subunit TssK n=1 Tax=Vibrio cholerae TaxID=666 RepID=UPI0004E44837|nr:type VI secretion system baseplate subunit TssK [Vibrio cholerae]EGR1074631.1 type VI secretion system baseplate subunit TssK [Vibrio cholerae]EGR2475254.1 type VI secretion system baseplate subunit TssK [Vibrio cholerae]KFD83065.1 hypothetical protein DN41_3164 [Vibrio cholerae]GHZ60294.1 type VI secretion system-associated protein [Vibrio cholerae]